MYNAVGFLNTSLDDMTWIMLFKLLSKWFQITSVNYFPICTYGYIEYVSQIYDVKSPHITINTCDNIFVPFLNSINFFSGIVELKTCASSYKQCQ